MGLTKNLAQEMNEQESYPVPAKRSIYNINNSYMELMQRIEDAEGIIDDEMSEALAITEKELQTKAVNYGYVMKQLDGEVELIDKEIERLTKMKKVKANTKDRLKTTIAESMQRFGIQRIENQNLTLSFKPSKTLVIQDEDLVPFEYLKTKEVITIDKAGLKKAVEQGAEYKGIWIQENSHLQIK